MRARGRGNHIITTAAEHHAVLDVAQELATEDFDVTFLRVDTMDVSRRSRWWQPCVRKRCW